MKKGKGYKNPSLFSFWWAEEDRTKSLTMLNHYVSLYGNFKHTPKYTPKLVDIPVFFVWTQKKYCQTIY